MFTGIIETTGLVTEVVTKGSNKIFWVSAPLSADFRVDQSVSHDGVCLTVEEIINGMHRVTAVDETLQKTNLSQWSPGSIINIERCLKADGRLDGHFVQGHVDTTGTCILRTEKSGSWEFVIEFPQSFAPLIIEKGSIAVNGISLTAFNVTTNSFTIAVIPYTFDHTSVRNLQVGDLVNLEFDMIGKYLQRKLSLQEQ
jgi:riboflavin synthase